MLWPQKELIIMLFAAIPCISIADDFRLVQVPSGEFKEFWSPPRRNKKLIKINSFISMDRPVTSQQYKSFLKSHPEYEKENISSLFADEMYLVDFNTNLKTENSAATQISWFAARAFCNFHQMRLPSLNEWEYMAAASENNLDGNKDPSFLKRILDWYSSPRNEKPLIAGSIYKNKYGIWDLHGLTWEWVEDFNTNFVTGESRENESLDKSMFCGADSLNSANRLNYAAFMRFAYRSGLKGKSSSWNLSFRCVRSK